ncbi:hypothetical protein HOY80DRAFT_1058953 [Tuber brumale]|nr:hypothetical protein HOY80DRAFT_1058953 [Tuber brumale]
MISVETTDGRFTEFIRAIFTSDVNGFPDPGPNKADEGSKAKQEKSNPQDDHLWAQVKNLDNCISDHITSIQKDLGNFKVETNKTIRGLRNMAEKGFGQVHTENMDTHETLHKEIKTVCTAFETVRTEIAKTRVVFVTGPPGLRKSRDPGPIPGPAHWPGVGCFSRLVLPRYPLGAPVNLGEKKWVNV